MGDDKPKKDPPPPPPPPITRSVKGNVEKGSAPKTYNKSKGKAKS